MLIVTRKDRDTEVDLLNENWLANPLTIQSRTNAFIWVSIYLSMHLYVCGGQPCNAIL